MRLEVSSWHWAGSVRVSKNRVPEWGLCTAEAEEIISLGKLDSH